MRVVLVHPAGSSWIRGQPDVVTPAASRVAPLGLLSLAAWLKQRGHDAVLHDCLGPRAPSGLRGNVLAILAARPELVGFSTTTSGFLDAYDMAVSLKHVDPAIRTVFGGVHVSSLGAPLLERYPAIDFLCVGEGEETLDELASGRTPASIPGLCCRDGDRVVTNAPRLPLKDLDRLPFPDYEGLAGFPAGYHLPLFSYVRRHGAAMATSRGCTYQCTYCDRSVFQRSYRYHSPRYIYDQMAWLRRRFGVRHINIYDDLFTLHRGRVAELCGLLAAQPLGVQFNCAVRVGHADDDLLQMLRDAGCLTVSLGIESGDPALLERHKAGVELEAVRETVARIKARGLRAKGLFMMGLPGETEASVRATSDFVLSLGLDDMNMTKFTPFPGAPIWRTIRDEGTVEEDWRLMNCLNTVFVPHGLRSAAHLDRLYNLHVKRFYSDRTWRHAFTRRLWQHRWSLWHLLVHLPVFLAARRQFEPGSAESAS